jgi:predicted Ser/Thr protein kinase
MPRYYLPAVALAYVASFVIVIVSVVWIDWWLTCAFYLHLFTLLMVVALTIASFRRTYIEIDSAEMHFPINLAGDLLFRLDRSWGDIAAVGIEDESSDYGFQSYAEELRKKLIFIYFKSGGHVNLHLCNIDLSYLKLFVDSLVNNSERGACTPEFLEMQKQLPYLRDEQALSDKSSDTANFTQFWEDELESYIGTTNFVPLESGHELQGGKFYIEKGICYGGMSAVYLGLNHRHEKIVIKESSIPIRCEVDLREKARELFEREALFLYKLEHPRIAKVLDYFVEDRKDYLVLEYIQGRSLRQTIRANGPSNEKDVVDIAMQVCNILQYLHSRDPQVLHRDLTPDNLILRADGQIVLIDFGAANEFIGTATGTVVGKQCYIAPEQFKGKAVPQSDLYSLGCTMHYLLTGEDPEPLSQSRPAALNALVSRGLDRVVSLATELEVSERTSSAANFVHLLDDLNLKIELCERRKQTA